MTNTASEPSRNIDELKRLVISALDKNGVLAELRSTVKLHVTRAINEDMHSPLVHPRNPRVDALMATEKGQLLTELVVDFLRYYELKDTLSMMLVEAGVPRLRPTEAELAGQCGFTYQPTLDLSVLEQYISRQPDVHYSPQTSSGKHEFIIHAEPTNETLGFPPPESASPDKPEQPLHIDPLHLVSLSPESKHDDSSLLSLEASLAINTSLDTDIERMRNISRHMERISLGGPEEASPRYEDDFERASDSAEEKLDESPMPPKIASKLVAEADDDVLFESRESLPKSPNGRKDGKKKNRSST